MEGIKVATKKLTRENVYDIISIALIGASLLFSVFQFREVFWRAIRSVWDVLTSIAYYFTELSGFRGVVTATVVEIPDGLTSVLPFEWETFTAQWELFGSLLINQYHIQGYFDFVLDVLGDIATWAVLLLPIVLLLGFIIWWIYRQPLDVPVDENGERIELPDSKPLVLYKRIEARTWIPVRDFVKGYVQHLLNPERRLAFKLLAIIWFYNLNLTTIILDLIAYAIFFCADSVLAFNVYGFYAQLVKLVADITVPIVFLPWWLQLYIGFRIFDHYRQKAGMMRLYMCEAFNRAFLKLYLGALFIVGKQRAKKTSIVTDMSLTQEIIYRDDAKANLAKRDKQFPFFPWRNVEELYWISQEKGTLPTLASIREFVKELQYRFQKRHLYRDAQRWPHLYQNGWKNIRACGYKWDDFLFGYDWERYGLTYNNGLKIVTIFEAIEAYMQHFYIYACPSSLIFSNYAIRTDIQWEDYGFWPVMDGDFFARLPENMYEESQYSKIGNQDYVRLGKRVDDQDPCVDGFEIGVWSEMETAKERGNQITNRAVQADDDSVNAKNDLREINFKMQGHASTIDNYTYFRPIMDDQRPDSLGADNKDLCDVLMVKSVTDANLVLPGFLIEEGIYALATLIRDKFYYHMRKLGRDNSLLVYLVNKLHAPINAHYERLTNKYSVYTASLRIWNAMSEEVLKKEAKYYICTYKTYRERFATDGIKAFYHAKALRAKKGTNQMPTYDDKHMSVEQMVKNRSLFYSKLVKMFLSGESGKLASNQTKKGGKKAA